VNAPVLSDSDKRSILALAKHVLRVILEGRFPNHHMLVVRRGESSIIPAHDPIAEGVCCVEMEVSFFVRPFGGSRSSEALNAAASIHIGVDKHSGLRKGIKAVIIFDDGNWSSFIPDGDFWELKEEIGLHRPIAT